MSGGMFLFFQVLCPARVPPCATDGRRGRAGISRVIRDLFLTDFGDRISTFEQFNGTPMLGTRMFTMKRSELSPSGPLTQLARKVCGLPEPEVPEVTAYTEQAEYARRLDGARLEGSRVR